MRDWGNGQGWLLWYVMLPRSEIITPDSSATSRATACSMASPTSTNPAVHGKGKRRQAQQAGIEVVPEKGSGARHTLIVTPHSTSPASSPARQEYRPAAQEAFRPSSNQSPQPTATMTAGSMRGYTERGRLSLPGDAAGVRECPPLLSA